MFCFQCEQTSQSQGCSSFGVCGKGPEAAALQDLIMEVSKGTAVYLQRAKDLGQSNKSYNNELVNALIYTVTNVNFDEEALKDYLTHISSVKDKAQEMFEKAGGKKEGLPQVASFTPSLKSSVRLIYEV